jgi:hypothetical protein
MTPLSLRLLLCFFLFFLLLLPTALSEYYEFSMLVLSWPVSYCRPPNNCIGDIPQYFTIHGLWPSTKFPPYPENCIGPDLKETDVCLSYTTYIVILYLASICFGFNFLFLNSVIMMHGYFN